MPKYPRLYNISNQQHQLINNVGSQKDAGWEWSFSWRRSLFENEIRMAAKFLEELAQVKIQQKRPNSWVWKADPSGNYSTKSEYRLLMEVTTGAEEDRNLVELWNLKIPFKQTVFALIAREKAQSKLTTLCNLHTSLKIKCLTSKIDMKWITHNLFFTLKL